MSRWSGAPDFPVTSSWGRSKVVDKSVTSSRTRQTRKLRRSCNGNWASASAASCCKTPCIEVENGQMLMALYTYSTQTPITANSSLQTNDRSRWRVHLYVSVTAVQLWKVTESHKNNTGCDNTACGICRRVCD